MMNRSPVRVGAVSYLNTKPLVYGLRELAPHADVVYDFPSRLADDLAAGRLDIALIPSIEYFQDATYTVVSNACIGCRGPVLSVKLFSRTPFEHIQSLALDEGSRASVALVRILLEQRFGVEPQLEPLPIGFTASDSLADAVLLIGDRAIHGPRDDFSFVWDMGEEWCRWAELPFVFAMWVSRTGTDLRGLDVALAAARDAGVSSLEEIAVSESAQVGLSVDRCLTYLRDNLYFYLGPEELRGLKLFYEHATRIGAAPRGLDLSYTASKTR